MIGCDGQGRQWTRCQVALARGERDRAGAATRLYGRARASCSRQVRQVDNQDERTMKRATRPVHAQS